MPRRIPALCGAGLAALSALAIATSAGAQAPTAQTLTVTEGASGTSNIVDNPPKSRRHGENTRFSVGDAILFTSPLLDASRRRIGRVKVSCWITKAGGFARAESDCLGVFELSGGKLYVSAALKFGATRTTGVVLAGTGAYQGLHGTFESVNHRDDTSTDTFNLTP